MPSEQDKYWMQRALELASRAEAQGEVPVGALVVKDDQVIGEGWNQPIGASDPSAHAEIIALRSAAKQTDNYRLPGCTLYVTIEPCAMCAGAIVHARISRVVFGAVEPKGGVVVSNLKLFDAEHLNHKVDYEGSVLELACSEKISQFFKRRRDQQKLNQ